MPPSVSFSRLKGRFRRGRSLQQSETATQHSPSRPPALTPPDSTARQTLLPAPLPTSGVLTPPLSRLTSSVNAFPPPNRAEQFWDQAYDELKKEDRKLVEAYEKILSRDLGATPDHADDNPNTIAQNDPDSRRRQMEQVVKAGLDRISREAELKQRLDTVTDVVLQAKTTIGFAVQALPQASLPWAATCVALEMFVNPIKETETNRKGIDRVTMMMDWYWSLTNPLLKNLDKDANELAEVRNELGKQIIHLYKSLLSYQIKSVCSYYRHRGLAFLRDLVKLDDWDGNMKDISDAETHVQKCSMEYIALQASTNLDRLVTGQRTEKDQQCLRDLRTTDPRDDKKRIEKDKGGLLPGSYSWVLRNPQFQRWRDDSESRLLWVKGDPGKGKTMLLCGIINELQRVVAGNTNNTHISWFFCQATDSRINSATAVLRGLIYLLVEQQPSLLGHVRKKYDHAGKSLFEGPNSWVALSGLLRDILQDPGLGTAYLVVDGLDECTADLPNLLDFFVHMASPSSRVKWLVSSRNEFDIELKLRSINHQARLSLELREIASQVSGAVDLFIDEKLSHVHSLQHRPKLKEKVRNALRDKANGTFLWVSLVVQELDRPESLVDPLAVVKEVPSGLHELYQRMMDRVKSIEACRQTLSITALAYRPLSLSEIWSLLTLPTDLTTETVRGIVGMCGSFLTIRDDQVSLIHHSAKDYLSDPATGLFPSGEQSLHYDIFRRSLEILGGILRRDMYQLRHPGVLIDDVTTPDPDPLAPARYSCVYWADHLLHWARSTPGEHSKREIARELGDCGTLHIFLKSKFLYWLEALSLLRQVSEGLFALEKISALLTKESPELTALIRDADRFILFRRWAIENAPLQIYATLVFSPHRSLVRKLFHMEEPDWMPLKPVVKEDWDSHMLMLDGHTEAAISLCFSHNGKMLVSASGDKTVKLWDIATRQCLLTKAGFSEWIDSIAFSPSDQLVALVSIRGEVKLWDIGSDVLWDVTPDKTWYAQKSEVAFSNGGQYLALGTDNIKLWKLTDTGGRPWMVDCRPVRCGGFGPMMFSPDDKLLATAHSSGDVIILDGRSGHTLRTLKGHQLPIRCLAFSANGQVFASASHDSVIKIWDPVEWRCLWTLRVVDLTGYRDEILDGGLACGSDGLVLIATSQGMVAAWDKATGQRTAMAELKGYPTEIGTPDKVRLLPGCQRIACMWSRAPMVVGVWDTSSGQLVAEIPAGSTSFSSMALSPMLGQIAASSEGDSVIKVWDVFSDRSITPVNHQPYENLSLMDIVFSLDGLRLASYTADGQLCIWDTASAMRLLVCPGFKKPGRLIAASLAFSKNGEYLVSNWDGHRGELRAAATGEVIVGFEDFMDMAISDDSRRLAVARKNGIIDLRDTATGDRTRILTTRTDGGFEGEDDAENTATGDQTARPTANRIVREYVSLIFSSSSRLIACARTNQQPGIIIWDVESGEKLHTLTPCVLGVAFSPDDRRLARSRVSGDDYLCKLEVCEVATGACTTTIPRSDHWSSIAFSPNGRWLAVISFMATESIELWDTAPSIATCLARLELRTYSVSKFSFDATGQHLVTDFGNFALDFSSDLKTWPITKLSDLRRTGYSISEDGRWIMRDSGRVLWLPPEHRPTSNRWWVYSDTVAVQTVSDRGTVLTVMKFSMDDDLQTEGLPEGVSSRSRHLDDIGAEFVSLPS
ncbi:Vegetative incompatibility protein HET-E-1 [Madurella fahalii]|uniref:Vegetative incompatibility protein HET-E-1 n=1 Tax=Madurella fahalii TaxID=1157608 RepID=A0ABQ0GNL0_9PEZI